MYSTNSYWVCIVIRYFYSGQMIIIMIMTDNDNEIIHSSKKVQ